MAEPIFQLTLSQLNELGLVAGRAGGEAALASFTERHERVVSLIDRSGAYKAVLSTLEAAHYASVTTATIRKWIRAGMPATAQGGRAGFQIRKADIDDWRTRDRAD